MTSLVEISDFATFLQVPDTELNADSAATVLSQASGLVRDFLGQKVDLVPNDVWTCRPKGGNLILLPELPIVNVSKVRIRRQGSQEWTELAEFTDYEIDAGMDGKLWRIGARTWTSDLVVTGATHSWPSAPMPRQPGGVVEITNTHGYQVIPETMGTVVCRVAARGYVNPEGAGQSQVGRTLQSFGGAPGLYLSGGDESDLSTFRPGGRGGST